jgi:hypothetical protein
MRIINPIKNILTVAIVFSSSLCFAQSAKDSTRSLQKIQARVESSVDNKDYTAALGDAIFEVKLYLSSPEAKERPEFTNSISKTLEHYQMAGEMWKRSMEQVCQLSCAEEEKNIAVLYPELDSQVRSGRVSVRELRKQAIQISFKKAEKELAITVSLFSQK